MEIQVQGTILLHSFICDTNREVRMCVYYNNKREEILPKHDILYLVSPLGKEKMDQLWQTLLLVHKKLLRVL